MIAPNICILTKKLELHFFLANTVENNVIRLQNLSHTPLGLILWKTLREKYCQDGYLYFPICAVHLVYIRHIDAYISLTTANLSWRSNSVEVVDDFDIWSDLTCDASYIRELEKKMKNNFCGTSIGHQHFSKANLSKGSLSSNRESGILPLFLSCKCVFHMF